jgi:hypothetical protein
MGTPWQTEPYPPPENTPATEQAERTYACCIHDTQNADVVPLSHNMMLQMMLNQLQQDIPFQPDAILH